MKRILTFVCGLCLVLATTVIAAVPALTSYQGLLEDGSGDPIADGTYSVAFTIYDALSGGNVLWSETQNVTTSNGLFSVLLGSATPIADSAFDVSSTYLGIKVGVDPEMSPRTELSTVPYAYHAGVADIALSTSSSGSAWFVGGDLGDLLIGNGELASYPSTEYEYGMRILGGQIVRSICTRWNVGLRFYNVEPFFVDADNFGSGFGWGGQMFYINTNDTDDDAASGNSWRHWFWKTDFTQASQPIVKFASQGISGIDVYVRKL